MSTNPADIFFRNNLIQLSLRRLRMFTDKIHAEKNGCWVWLSTINNAGYGIFVCPEISAIPVRAHRIAYRIAVGEITEGLQVHHTCNNRKCVNPEHLEVLTPKEHVHKTPGSCGYEAIKSGLGASTHCVHGHEYTPETTGRRTVGDRAGERYCKVCDSMQAKQRLEEYRKENPVQPKTHCARGHEFSPENTYYRKNRDATVRACKRCRYEDDKARVDRTRDEWNRKRREKRARKKQELRAQLL